MSPITQAFASHAEHRAADIALVIDHESWSWGALMDEITHRAHKLKESDPLAPTFFVSDAAASDCALNGLARLHLGLPIVGTTSGSTAAAKRYRRSQDSWIASFEAQQREFPVHASDVVIAPGSLLHSLFSYALCQGLFVGAKVVLSESFRPDRARDQLTRHQGSVLIAVPTQLKMLCAACDGPSPSLRLLVSSGARWFADMTAGLAQRFPQAEIIEFYGASETSFISLARHSTDTHLPTGSVGRVFHGVDLKVAPDQAIFVSSSGLFDGYLGESPSDFSEKTDADGRRWISVGDCGALDASGYLFLSGRQSRKIVTSGKNLYPEEIEQCLLTHPVIEHAALFGLADDLRGERLVAAIAVKAVDQLPSRAELISFLAPMLEDFKIPREFVPLNPWPMTATGKTDFAAVRRALDLKPL